jgi:VWFA-related protein
MVGTAVGAVGMLVCSAAAQSKLTVTVVDQAGAPVADLKAPSFSVSDKTQRTISDAVYKQDPCDIVLMIEASAFTKSQKSDIERIAILLIDQVGPNDHMALVGFADTSELLQEFTSSKKSLVAAVSGLRFENNVSVFDAAYGALDSGFQNALGRKILVIITGGQEGVSSNKKQNLVELAERRQVSVFAISLQGRGGVLQDLTQETAGAMFSSRDLKPMDQVVKSISASFHGRYELTVEGLELVGNPRVEVKGAKDRWQITHRKE